MTDRVADGRALLQLCLCLLVTDGAGQTGVQGAVPLREGIVHTLFTHRVVVVGAVLVHTLSHRADRARLALPRDLTQEEVVVANADGVVGVSAGRLHAHHPETLGTRHALLRVAVVL